MNNEEKTHIEQIKKEAGLDDDEIEELIQKKIDNYKGLVSRGVAITMILDDLGLNKPKKIEKKKSVKKEVNEEKKEEETPEIQEAMPLVPLTAQDIVSADTIKYPSEEEIRFKIKRLQFIKKELINSNDWQMIKSGAGTETKHLKRSAVQKYINAFGISIDILEGPIFLDRKITLEGYDNNPFMDRGVRYRVKAIAPTGQFVLSDGTKFQSEYWSKKFKNFGSYNEHNLTTTALTRAIKHAVLDLIGYGEEEGE